MAILNGAATVLTVSDIDAAIAYYRDQLGFGLTFQFGEPIYYACFCRDAAQLHLIAHAFARRQPGQGAISIFVDDVDAIHAELVERGAKVLQAPQDYAYGMRDFNVSDPDGNQITFGAASKST